MKPVPALFAAWTAALAVSPAPPAQAASALSGIWHVGPVPGVRAICHAGDSLYVGTDAGLFIVDIRDPSRVARLGVGPALPSNSVGAVAARGDSVFVGTDAGLLFLRGGNARVFTPREPGGTGAVPLDRIEGVCFGARGEVLLSTRGRGVGVLTAAGRFSITTRDSLLDDRVFDVLDRAGRPRLFATAAGLCAQTDDTTFVSFQAGAGIPRGEVRQVVGDARTAYLRVARRGVYRFDGMRATPVEAPADIPLPDAASISLGSDGALWAAGAGWIAVRRNGRWSDVATERHKNRHWRVVTADGAGAFAGSSDGLVLAVDRGAAFQARLAGELPAGRVVSIRPDGRGSAWFVCGGRVVRADAGAARVSVENPPLDAQAVEFSPEGVVAAGRWTVSRLEDSGWTDLRPSIAEADPSFSALAVDRDGVLWVGAGSGSLYRFDGGIWVRYARSRGDAPAIRNLAGYRDGSWALLSGTPALESRGYWGAFAGWDSSSTAVDVAMTPRGEWIAATRTELLRLDPAGHSWRHASAIEVVRGGEHGGAKWTPGAHMSAVAFDASGTLWVGTDDGIEWVGARGTGRLGGRDGIGGDAVADLAADGTYLWIGFVRDGMSVVPLETLR